NQKHACSNVCSYVIRYLKACLISWRQLSVAYDDAPATREVASPVSRVRDANRQCELIAQAGRVWQGRSRPRRSILLLPPSAPARSHILADRQNEMSR